jgi:hypothetical protein
MRISTHARRPDDLLARHVDDPLHYVQLVTDAVHVRKDEAALTQSRGLWVVQQSGLVTFEGTGEDVDRVAVALRNTPGVEAAAVFGRALRVASLNREALKRAIETGGAGLSWAEVEPRLDDVFIHMLYVQEAQT